MYGKKDNCNWRPMYNEILAEFAFDANKDQKSAHYLADILKMNYNSYHTLQKLIKNKTVFVLGSGPSLDESFDTIIRNAKDAIIIAADTSLKPLLQNYHIIPDVIVTDLDGDIESHVKASQCGAIMAVHAHSDNIHMLHHAKRFKTCIGTTQTAPLYNVRNFGGFTDGDRAIFLTAHFMPKNIILFGMDFGTEIGRHSNTAKSDYLIKIRKMQLGKNLVEKWFARDNNCNLFNTSSSSGVIRGFESITHTEIDALCRNNM